MKPQGNDNALYSLEMVTCLAFYLVIQFLFGATNMHDILEFCPFLKFNLSPPLKKTPTNMFSTAWPLHWLAPLIHKRLCKTFL